MDNEVDAAHGALITYLGRLSLENLSEAQSQLLYDYMATTNYFENIGDMIEHLKGVYYFAKRTAKLVIEEEMEYLENTPSNR